MNYLPLALWMVFFYDAIVMLLLPSSVNLIIGTDGSAARYVVDIAALGITSFVLINKGFKRLENKWIIIFLLAVVASHFHSPNINIDSAFVPKDMAIYNYKPMFELLAFTFMFLAIMSLDFTKELVDKIFKSICWISSIYGIYILFQRFGMDQFYQVSGVVQHLSRNPESGGFIGQPVFAAAFLALCLPFVLKNGSVWMILANLAGILATGNRSACIAAVICYLMFFPYWNRVGKLLLIGYVGFLLTALLAHCLFPLINLHFEDTGRLAVWQGMFQDFIHPKFPGINTHYILTGHGIGSFSILYPFYHQSSFYQAHNELFEVIYTTGICGLVVFVLAVKDLVNQPMLKPIGLGILAISICALTNPVWHVPQLAFITVFLVGLAYNKGVNYVEK